MSSQLRGTISADRADGLRSRERARRVPDVAAYRGASRLITDTSIGAGPAIEQMTG